MEERESATFMKRNSNLDLLRIFACLGVMGLHSFDQSIGLMNRVIYLFCGFSVPIFFMISGYTLLSKDEVSVKYSITKIVALIRIVLLWDVVKYCLYFFLAIKYNNLGNWMIGAFIKDSWQGLIQEGTHWHFWYLGTLMIIYFMLPVLNTICKNNKVLVALWSILFIVSVVLQITSYKIGHSIQKEVIQTFRLWTAFQYLLLGGIIARFKDRIAIKKLPLIYGVITVIWITTQMIIVNKGIGEVWAEYYYDALIAIIWNAVFFTMVIKSKVTEKTERLILKFAPITFGIYIVHPLILDIQCRYIHAQTFLLSIVQYVVLATASVVFAGFLLKFVPKLVKL